MSKNIAIIGGGPAGLMAAEIISAQSGFSVTVFERKPSPARKFLMAGRGGLNLTHSEPWDSFLEKYRDRADVLKKPLQEFSPQSLRNWCDGLGEKTFIGSSGRVFPESFKASPLLRAWLARLRQQGVSLMMGHDWQGWQGDSLIFKTASGNTTFKADATLLALGGASWPRLGSDGSWAQILKAEGIDISPLEPANCGFAVEWSDIFRQKFSGHPLKPVIAAFKGTKIKSEIMITEKGIEGSAIYALSSVLRQALRSSDSVFLELDLKPDLTLDAIESRLKKPRGRDTFSNFLRKALNFSPLATGLLMEHPDRKILGDYKPAELARLIKSCPVRLYEAFSLERAISTAGGIRFESLDQNYMLAGKPGVFIAGEMLDWEAPTGGYLLQATMSTAVYAAHRMMAWLESTEF
ncbi:MAG: TIGR03862 family flavoprotein [Alphaproteobacteria bacterium]|nr:TIGR03862 family flavoprotein [Alphaproteobacteria bacterium]